MWFESMDGFRYRSCNQRNMTPKNGRSYRKTFKNVALNLISHFLKEDDQPDEMSIFEDERHCYRNMERKKILNGMILMMNMLNESRKIPSRYSNDDDNENEVSLP